MRDLPTFHFEDLKEIVQRGYGIRVLKIIPHRNVYRLETNLGTHFFKPFLLSEEKLQLIASAKEHLLNQGFTRLIPFVPTLAGKPYYKQGNQLFYMTEWIEGHPSNYDNPFELRHGVQMFAEFHQAAQGFQPEQEVPSYLGRWPEIFAKRLEDLQICKERAKTHNSSTGFETLFLQQADYYIEEAVRSLQLLAESGYHYICTNECKKLPFCHHDAAHHNVMITTKNEPMLIDYDYLIRDLHIHDLASLVIRNGKASGWNLKRCAFLLNTYQSVQSVSLPEMKVMQAFMVFPYDIWHLIRARYLSRKPWPLGYYLKEWERKTRNEEARQVFLRRFLELG